jgi:hypothetical protein
VKSCPSNPRTQRQSDDLQSSNNDSEQLAGGYRYCYTVAETPIIDCAALHVSTAAHQPDRRLAGHYCVQPGGLNSLVVLDTFGAQGLQVQTTDGARFTLRIRPYRTLENNVITEVITFSDVSDLKRAELALRPPPLRWHAWRRYATLSMPSP